MFMRPQFNSCSVFLVKAVASSEVEEYSAVLVDLCNAKRQANNYWWAGLVKVYGFQLLGEVASSHT